MLCFDKKRNRTHFRMLYFKDETDVSVVDNGSSRIHLTVTYDEALISQYFDTFKRKINHNLHNSLHMTLIDLKSTSSKSNRYLNGLRWT